MNSLKNSNNSIQTTVLYIISDQTADLTYLYSRLGIEPLEQQGTCLRFEIFKLIEKTKQFQLYLFPRNREVKTYCELYNQILPKPELIIYVVDGESSIKQSIEWLNLFEKDNSLRFVFLSSAKTYLQRQHILTKMNTLFLRDISYHSLFPNLDPSALDNCLYNVDKNMGISMQQYSRLIPAFSRLKWIWKKITNKKKRSHNQNSII